MEKQKQIIVIAAVVIAIILIAVTIAVSNSGVNESYFNPIVNASKRNEILTDTPSKNGSLLFKSDISVKEAFEHYDKDKNGRLMRSEFDNILTDLFRDAFGNPHSIDSVKATEMYSIFSKDGEINLEEFELSWNCWIKTVLRPVSAFVVIDVQNDFITGALPLKDYPAKEDGADVVPVVNKLLETVPFDNIFYTQDWHPNDHISFFDNLNLPGREFAEDSPIQTKSYVALFDEVIFKGPPKTKQKLWPRHCVQESEGAKLHKDLLVHRLGQMIRKGSDPKIDSYSAFFDNEKLAKTDLDDLLKAKGVTDVYTSGIATDVCVSHTSNDAQDLGYRTILIQDASKGIIPEAISDAKDSIRANNGLVVDAKDVKDIVQGLNRPFELGYAKALRCKMK